MNPGQMFPLMVFAVLFSSVGVLLGYYWRKAKSARLARETLFAMEQLFSLLADKGMSRADVYEEVGQRLLNWKETSR